MLRHLYVQVMAGALAGILVGHLWPGFAVELGPLGIAFIKTMRMMVPPILFCTIVDGIVLHGGALRTGTTVIRALIVFLAITMMALLTGLLAASVLHPGAGLRMPPAPPGAIDMHRQLAGPPIHGAGDFLLRMVPETFFSAFTAGDILPVLFIAALVGFGLLRLGDAGEPITRAVRVLAKLQFAIVGFLLRIAPVGAFGAIAYTVGAYGIGFISSLGLLIATFALACAGLAAALLMMVRARAGLSPTGLLRHFRDEFLIVAGTSSSEVVLPRLMTKLEGLGAEPAVVGLMVPLGYTLNLAGTAVYLVVATLFLADALHIPMPPERIGLYLAVMLVTSKASAGVIGSGFSALLLTLSLLPDVPVGAAAMLIAVDRLLSTMRALTSGIANISATLLVARWNGGHLSLGAPPPTPGTAG